MEDRLNCQISSLVKYHQNPNKKSPILPDGSVGLTIARWNRCYIDICQMFPLDCSLYMPDLMMLMFVKM